MNENTSFISLVNPPFTIQLGDREFQVRKASIEQVAQYQIKFDELSKDTTILSSVRDLEMVSYCVYLIINKSDSTVSLDFVRQNIPGSTDALKLLSDLGFIDPQKVEMMTKLQEKLITESSLRLSQQEQAGLQEKSVS